MRRGARAFLDAGIHVICDKPLTTSVAEARGPGAHVRENRLLFALTYKYSGHPMVRQAREMVEEGALGAIRVVQVEYAQDWLATPIEATGQKQAGWRTDPRQRAGRLRGRYRHACLSLAAFVTGLRRVSAELHTFVPGRRLDDHAQAMLRFEGGARGMLWASQVAPGARTRCAARLMAS